MKKHTFFFFWCLQIFSFAGLAGARADESVEYWERAGLTFEKLRTDVLTIERDGAGTVQPVKCGTDANYLLACVYGLNAILEKQPTPMILLPPGKTVSGLLTAPALEGFGTFQLMALKRAGADYGLKVRARAAALRVWRDYFQTAEKAIAADTIPPINQIMDWLAPKVTSKEQGIDWAVSALHGFYQVYFSDHSRPQVLQELEEQLKKSEESFTGVGLRVGFEGTYPRVINVLAGGPAAQAGIRPGDQLVRVGELSTENGSMYDLVRALNGEAGTSVSLAVLKPGATAPVELPVERRKIELNNVTSRILQGVAPKLGYISLLTFFRQRACSDVEKAVVELSAQGAEGLILDLRGNGGGLLDQAVCIADLFLGRQQLVTETKPVIPLAEPKKYFTERTALTEMPLVVLVDEGSASASEILAGALADHQRAVLVGHRTFGKGTVQAAMISPFRDLSKNPAQPPLPLGDLKGVVLFVTTSRFYLPSGHSNQLLGIYPHVTVFRRPDQNSELSVRREESDAINPVAADGQIVRRRLSAEVAACLAGKTAANDFQAPGIDGGDDFQLLKARDTLLCRLTN